MRVFLDGLKPAFALLGGEVSNPAFVIYFRQEFAFGEISKVMRPLDDVDVGVDVGPVDGLFHRKDFHGAAGLGDLAFGSGADGLDETSYVRLGVLRRDKLEEAIVCSGGEFANSVSE